MSHKQSNIFQHTPITHSTWSTNTKYGLHGHIIRCEVVDPISEFFPLLPKSEALLRTLYHKVIIGVQDPLFNLITNSRISGQQVLEHGIPTGEFKTIEALALPYALGSNRQLTLNPIFYHDTLLGYNVDVEQHCTISIHNRLYLNDVEKRFYSNFIFTVFEPTSAKLSGLVNDCIAQESIEMEKHYETATWVI